MKAMAAGEEEKFKFWQENLNIKDNSKEISSFLGVFSMRWRSSPFSCVSYFLFLKYSYHFFEQSEKQRRKHWLNTYVHLKIMPSLR